MIQPMLMSAVPVSRFSSEDGMVASCATVPASRLAGITSLESSGPRRIGAKSAHSLMFALDDPDFVAQLVHQLLRDFRRRSFQYLGLFRLLRNIQFFDLLQVFSQG